MFRLSGLSMKNVSQMSYNRVNCQYLSRQHFKKNIVRQLSDTDLTTNCQVSTNRVNTHF